MKTITFLTILFFSVTSMFSQSIVFFQNDTQLENDAEITITEVTKENYGTEEAPSWFLTMESELHLKNLTSQNINTEMRQIVLNPPSAGLLSFCFGLCTDTNEDLILPANPADPLNHIIITANSFYNSLHLCFIPELDMFTTAKVKYSVYDRFNPDDVYSVTINYNYTSNSGIDDMLTDKGFSVFQNGNNTVFKYMSGNANMNLTVYNITGQIVSKHLLPNSGDFILPEQLTKGLYIYSITEGNKQVFSQKFIIK